MQASMTFRSYVSFDHCQKCFINVYKLHELLISLIQWAILSFLSFHKVTFILFDDIFTTILFILTDVCLTKCNIRSYFSQTDTVL
jgi:hypothetical protein